MNLLESFITILRSQKPAPSKATVKNYKADIARFIRWFENTYNIPFEPKEVTPFMLDAYKKFVTQGENNEETDLTIQTTGSSPLALKSFQRHLSSLRKFFNFLKVGGYIQTTPFEQLATNQPASEADIWHLKAFKDHLYVYNASDLTIKNYITDVKQFLTWAETVIQPTESWIVAQKDVFSHIDTKLVNEYKKRLYHQAGLSPVSINRKLSSLRRFIIWAQKEQYLTINKEITITNEAISAEEAKTYAHPLSQTEVIQPQIEAEKSEENAPSGTEKAQVIANAKYSNIPPIRLFQKLGHVISLGIESAMIAPIAAVALKLHFLKWKLTGASVFVKSAHTAVATTKKLSAAAHDKLGIVSVKNFKKEMYAPHAISLANLPVHRKAWHHIRHTRPDWYRRYHQNPLAHYFHFAILMVVMTAIGVGLYQGFVNDPAKNRILAAPSSPPRILSFQGRLTDSSDNPITTAATPLRFAIYNDASASGSALLWQEVDSVSPDSDGIFSILLGNNTTIPQNLFGDNQSLWLGVTVQRTDELTPRQQIATVPYATNSELLQGMAPITQVGAGVTNVVLALNSSGNLVVSSGNPTFQATGGTFTIQGTTTVISTTTGSAGNVQIAPDGLGKIDLQKPVFNSTNNNNIASAIGAVEVDDLFAILATSSGQSAFTLNQNGSGPLISASASGVAKFTVGNTGQITDAAYTTGGGIIYGTSTGVLSQTAAGTATQCLLGGTTPTWGSCGGNYWDLQNGLLYAGNTTVDFAIGGTSSTSAKFAVLNVIGTGTPTASVSAGTNGAAFLSADGTLSTTARQSLTLGNSSTNNTTGNILLHPNGTGNVGVGDTSNGITAKLQVNGGNTTTGNGGQLRIGSTDAAAIDKGGTLSFATNNSGALLNRTAAEISGRKEDATTGERAYLQFVVNGTGGILERMRITSTGNVGIANTAPGTTLDITGTLRASGVVTFSNYTNNGGIFYGNGSGVISQTAAGTSSQCLLGGTTPTFGSCNAGGYWDQQNGALYPANTTWDFFIGGNATASANFAVLNNAAGIPVASVSGNFIVMPKNGGGGNVGIGRTSPTALLDLGAGILKFSGNATLVGSGVPEFANVSGFGLQTASSQYGFKSVDGATTRIGIDTNGNVGINTSAPLGNFHVNATTNTRAAGIFDTTMSNDVLTASASGSTLFVVKNNGNVGIGTNLPGNKLEVNGNANILGTNMDSNSGTAAVNVNGAFINIGDPISSQTFTNGVGIKFYDAGTAHGSIKYLSSSDRMDFCGSSATGTLTCAVTPTLSLLSVNTTGGGRVGVGTSAPTYRMQVSGTAIGTVMMGVTQTSTTANDILYYGSQAAVTGQSSLLNLTGASTTGVLADFINSDTTNSTANSRVNIQTGGASAGDPFLMFTISGVLNWAAGVDNSDSDKFKISGSSALGTNDYLTLTTAGVLALPAYTTNGGLLYTNGSGVVSQTGAGTSAQCLTGGTTPTYQSCNIGPNDFLWGQANGALYPNNSTVDLLVGGQSTTSAKFAVLNVIGTGTPTASVSAGSAGAAYLSASGTLATTAKQTLTLGDSTTTGNIIINPSGNIGIGGTATPTQKVFITGNSLVNGVSYFGSTSDFVNASGVASFASATLRTGSLTVNSVSQGVTLCGSCGAGTQTIQVNAGGQLVLTNSNTSGKSIALMPFASGGVGIGTTAPAHLLHVTGIMGDNAIMAVNAANSTSDIFTASASGTTRFVVRNNGNVGIGTNLPSTTVDIVGTLKASGVVTFSNYTTNGGLLYTNGSGVISQTSAGASTQCLLGGTTPFFGSCGGGLWDQNNGFLYAGNTTVDFGIGGTGSTSAKFAVVGVNTTTPAASLAGTLSIKASTATQTTSTFNLLNGTALNFTTSVGGDAGATSRLFIDRDGNGGNIGIGTTTPVARLNIFGINSSTDTGITVRNNGKDKYVEIQRDNSGTEFLRIIGAAAGTIGGGLNNSFAIDAIGPSAATTRPIYFRRSSDGGSTYNYMMALDSSSGNVGIGLISPLANFHVSGTTNTRAGLLVDVNTLNDIFAASASGTTKFVIKNDGNVGIGINLPAEKLDVVGNVKVSGTTNFGGIAYTWPGSQSANYVLQTNGSGTLSWVDPGGLSGVNYWNSANGTLYPKIVTQDLLLGGVSTASAKFAVINMNSGNPTATISSNLALIVPTGTQQVASLNLLNGSALNVTTSVGGEGGATSRLYVARDGLGGNIGIGTTAPAGKLHVTEGSGNLILGNGSFGGAWGVITADSSGISSTTYALASNTTAGTYLNAPTSREIGLRINNATKLIVDQNGNVGIGDTTPTNLFVVGSGDVFQVNSSGAIAAATGITSSGTITFSALNGTNGVIYGTSGTGVLAQATTSTQNLCLISGVSAPSWASCNSVVNDAFWQQQNGALFPNNSTVDFLIGGQASSSAKFAVLNVIGTNTPTASISAGTAITGGAYLTAAGNLATTNRQTLTLGNTSLLNTTGNILLNPSGTGNVGIGTSDATGGHLSIASTTTNATIYNPNSGVGVILRGNNSGSTGQLRIIQNTGAWADATSTTYFQMTNSTNNNATFMGGTYGSDTQLTRLQFNSLLTTVTDLAYGSTPVPTALFEAINSTAAKTVLKLRGATSQSGDYINVNSVSGSSGDILTLKSTGYLGLGTTAPAGNLHISATVNSQAVGIFDTTMSNDLITASASGTMRFVVKNNGNVGIGTNLPNAKLSVIGLSTFIADSGNNSSTTRPSQITIQGATNNNIKAEIGVDTTMKALVIGALEEGVAWKNIVLANNGGNIGIGITNPAEKLDVVGNIKVSGTTNFGGIAYTWPGSQTASYVLQTNGFGTLSWVDVANINGSNFWNQNNGALYPRNSTVDLLIGGISTASAKFAFINVNSGTPTASISSNFALKVPTGNNPAVSFDGYNGASLNFRTASLGMWDGGERSALYVANNGNIGINTTSPANPFTMKSSLSSFNVFQINATDNGALAAIFSDGSENAWLRLYDTSANEQIRLNTAGNSYFTGGNVGIGETAPTQPLQITTSTANLGMRLNNSAVGGPFIYLNATNATAGNRYTGLLLESNGTQQWNIGLRAGDGLLHFFDSVNSLDRMAINSNGNVGIGTTAPVANLHVAGTVNTRAAAIFDTTMLNDILTASASGTTRFVIKNDGNVGINTNLPGAQLEVRTSGGVGGAVRATTYADINGNYFLTPAATSTSLVVAGNVGIGTTAPDTLLNVVGTGGVYNTTPISMFNLYNNSTTAASNAAQMTFFAKRNGDLQTAIASISAVLSDANSATLYRGDLVFSTANMRALPTERMRINGFGQVGIGTSLPATTMEILSANNTDTLRLRSTTGQIRVFNFSDSINYFESGNAGWTASQLLQFTGFNGGAGTFNFVGSVGIGTTAPTGLLSVGDNLSNTDWSKQITIGNTGASAGMYIGQSSTTGMDIGWQYNATTASAYGLIQGRAGSYNLLFQRDGGSVGIGVTTLANLVTKFDVQTASGRHWAIRDLSSTAQLLAMTDGAASYTTGMIDASSLLLNSQNAGGAGNVGVGLTNPTGKFHINYDVSLAASTQYFASRVGGTITGNQSASSYYGTYVAPNYGSASGSTMALLQGGYFQPYNNSTGTITSLYGVQGIPINNAGGNVGTMIGGLFQPDNVSGTTTTMYGTYIQPINSSSTVTTYAGVRLVSNGGGGTITNKWGIYDDTGYAWYNSGNIGAGTNAPGAAIDGVSSAGIGVQGTTTTNIGVAANLAGTCSTYLAWNNAGGQNWTNCPVGGFTSDARLKKDITPITGGLNTIMALKPVTYLWNNDNKNAPSLNDPSRLALNYGFIAQDVMNTLPDLVGEGPALNSQGVVDPSGTRYYYLTYMGILPPLVNAVQDLNTKVEVNTATLSAQLAAIPNLNLSSTGNLAISSTPDPVRYQISKNGGVFTQIAALSDVWAANVKAGIVDAQKYTVAGQDLKDYIIAVVQNAGFTNNNNIVAPIASIDRVYTNALSPLPSGDGAVHIDGNLAVAGSATVSGTLTASKVEGQDGVFNGTLRAKNIIADNIEGLNAVIATLSAQTVNNITNVYNSSNGASSSASIYASEDATHSALLASLGLLDQQNQYASQSGNLNLTHVTADFGTFNQGLIALGPSSFTDVSVAGQFSVGGSLILADNAINTLGTALEIQSLKQGAVSIMGGLIHIDTNGDVQFGGTATFAKDVRVNGKIIGSIISPIPNEDMVIELGNDALPTTAQFKIKNASGSAVFAVNQAGDVSASGSGTFTKLNLSLVQQAVATGAGDLISFGSAGVATISANRTEVTVHNTLVTDKSLIYITPVGTPSASGTYLMRQKPGESFTVGGIAGAVFNWLIIN